MCKICLNKEHTQLRQLVNEQSQYMTDANIKLEGQQNIIDNLETQLKLCTARNIELGSEIFATDIEIRDLHNQILDLEARIVEYSLIAESIEKLKPAGTIDINEMSSILLDKLDEMGDKTVELYLADINCKVYKKEDVVKFLELTEVDKIPYIAETMDCDDYAAELYGLGIPLLWTNTHALNWFVDENNTLWFVEPQTDKIAKDLENWQGWDCRMFLSR